MDIRFEDAPQAVYEMMERIIAEHFQELSNCKILILMDLKERKVGDQLILGRMSKTNDLTRHLTIDNSGSDFGYDYIMYLDKMMWITIEKKDRIRIMRHELRHTQVNPESKNQYGLRGHTVEDFHSEIVLNMETPRWRDQVGELVRNRYDIISNPQRKLPLNEKN